MVTTLVHAARKGTHPWWHSPAICRIPRRVDHDLARQLSEEAIRFARVGVDALLLSPIPQMIWGVNPELISLVKRFHRVGVNIIVHLPGSAVWNTYDFNGPYSADETVTTLLGRVRACVDAGVDGIDFGTLPFIHYGPDSVERQEFMHLLRVVMAEVANTDTLPILTSSLPHMDDSDLQEILQESWFHHLRNDTLLDIEWKNPQLCDAIANTFANRDPVGHVAAWPALPYDDSEIHRARTLFALALPGATYFDSPLKDTISSSFVLMVQQALRTREEHGMGTGSLAHVRGLPWAGPDCLVHMSAQVMVVFNTSDTTVVVPCEHRPLVSTGVLPTSIASDTLLAPGQCAWFETARIHPRAFATE